MHRFSDLAVDHDYDRTLIEKIRELAILVFEDRFGKNHQIEALHIFRRIDTGKNYDIYRLALIVRNKLVGDFFIASVHFTDRYIDKKIGEIVNKWSDAYKYDFFSEKGFASRSQAEIFIENGLRHWGNQDKSRPAYAETLTESVESRVKSKVQLQETTQVVSLGSWAGDW